MRSLLPEMIFRLSLVCVWLQAILYILGKQYFGEFSRGNLSDSIGDVCFVEYFNAQNKETCVILQMGKDK